MTGIVSVVGSRNSGKTALIERLIPSLKARGLRVAALKHDVHGFQMDHEGKDTYRFSEAGADAVGIVSPKRIASLENVEGELSPERFLQGLVHRPDLLLVEGFKRRPYPKLEVLEPSSSSCFRGPLLLATFGSTSPSSASHSPHFTEVEQLAALLADVYGSEVGEETAAFVVAGGKGGRMGQNKPAVRLAEEPLICWVLRGLAPFFTRISVVARNRGDLEFLRERGIEVLPDVLQEVHSLGGLYSALVQADSEYSFVCACDSPFLQPLLLREILGCSRGDDAVVCEWKGFLEPFCGLYRKTCLTPIETMLNKGELRLQKLLAGLQVRILPEARVAEKDPCGFSFLDVDTPEELERAERLIGRHREGGRSKRMASSRNR